MEIVDCLATIYAGLAAAGGAVDAASVGGDERLVEAVRRCAEFDGGYDSPRYDRDLVQAALRHAAGHVATGAPGTDLLVAVQELRDRLSDKSLNALLADFVAIAMRDDRFESPEALLINAIRRSWNVDPEDVARSASDVVSADTRQRLWSILTEDERAGSHWTPVHDLALVYLCVAHRSDGELSRTEIDAITRKLAEWLPSALPSDVLNVVDDALRRYANGEIESVLQDSVSRMVDAVPDHQRPVVIRDLMFVAAADNVVLVEEKQLIAEIAKRWNIELE